jgi:hypothetical protein
MVALLALAGFRAFGGAVHRKAVCQADTVASLATGSDACADAPAGEARTPNGTRASTSTAAHAAPSGPGLFDSVRATFTGMVCASLICAMPPQVKAPPPPAQQGGMNEARVIRERGEKFYKDHSAKPGSCGNCHALAKDPGFATKREWQDAVLKKIGVKRDELRGYTRFTTDNQKIMKSIYGYYRSVFQKNEDMLWAGMAVLAGRSVWKGLSDNVQYRGFIPSAHTDRIAKMLEEELMTMNLAIFLDLGWMHEAYLEKGLPELEARFEAGDIDEATIAAWRKIDSGIRNKNEEDVQEGNKMLLRREQEVILTPGYANITRIPGINLGRTMGRMAESPVPGGRRFSVAVPGGSLANFTDRWKWIEGDMVKHWNRMPRKDRLYYVETPITNELTPPLRLDMFRDLERRPAKGGPMDDATRKMLLEWLEQEKKKDAPRKK